MANGPFRCVVLHHEGVADPHFDLMVETAPGSPLATWRADRWPLRAGDTVVRSADHRAAYLELEGPISGDRGRVRRVFAARCTHVAVRADHAELTFEGGVELTMTRDSPQQWFCWVAPDDHALGA